MPPVPAQGKLEYTIDPYISKNFSYVISDAQGSCWNLEAPLIGALFVFVVNVVPLPGSMSYRSWMILAQRERVIKGSAIGYNWANPIGNLFNAEYLPAGPFRSDVPPTE